MIRARRRKRDNCGRIEESGLGPADFPMSGAKSRAAARMLAEVAQKEAEAMESDGDPRYGLKGKFVTTKEPDNVGGMIFRVQWVPGGST